MKKVLLVVIDALTSRVVLPALEAGQLQNMAKLVDRGQLFPHSISIFPSITPAATCALVTGAYPRETGIGGAYWYDQKEDRVYFFGSDISVIYRKGFSTFINDFLYELNMTRLRCLTMYERVERARHTSGCLNFMWFKGPHGHSVHTPWLLKLWPGMTLPDTLEGPDLLFLGNFVGSDLREQQEVKPLGGASDRFGFCDKLTSQMLLKLVENDAMPDFTVAYFPDNDYDSHAHGPANAIDTLQAVDDCLGEVFDAYGGVDKLLDQFTIVITGDHSQSDNLDEPKEKVGIKLNDLLEPFELVPAGEAWKNGEELMACENMRATQLYFRPDIWMRREQVIDRLLSDSRVDQVIWVESPGDPQHSHHIVQTANRGTLRFGHVSASGASRQTGDSRQVSDEYGNQWWYSGDLNAVDARVEGQKIYFKEYPNAFERLFASFDPTISGSMWVTAHTGHEFCTEVTGPYDGGSHAGLNAEDSLSPLIVAGAPTKIAFQAMPRSVDVMTICLQCLDIKPPRALESGHAEHLAEQLGNS